MHQGGIKWIVSLLSFFYSRKSFILLVKLSRTIEKWLSFTILSMKSSSKSGVRIHVMSKKANNFLSNFFFVPFWSSSHTIRLLKFYEKNIYYFMDRRLSVSSLVVFWWISFKGVQTHQVLLRMRGQILFLLELNLLSSHHSLPNKMTYASLGKTSNQSSSIQIFNQSPFIN